MTNPRNRLLVIQVAGLGWEFLRANDACQTAGLTFGPAETIFPAVTCTVQASFRTASLPGEHGMVANGRYFPELHKVMFWEQAASLVAGDRVWQPLREAGGQVALLFWQQSLGESVDGVVSPAPIHRHHGGMIPACYSRPPELVANVTAAVGSAFKLQHYWGPLASVRSSDWVSRATAALLQSPDAPDLCFTYLPGLDYDLQRYGPGDRRSRRALSDVRGQLAQLVGAARDAGYDVIVFGDYAIAECPRGPVFPNRALAEAGLLATRDVKGMQYLDLNTSPAFAVVDHEIAHVHLRDTSDIQRVATTLSALPGVERLLDRTAQAEAGVQHTNSGDLLAVASDGYWFAYPWWRERRQAPDFAGHVDIHNKPGYDPCELFWGWPPGSVSQDPQRIRGSHGRIGAGREVAAAWTWDDPVPESLLDVSRRVATWSRDFQA